MARATEFWGRIRAFVTKKAIEVKGRFNTCQTEKHANSPPTAGLSASLIIWLARIFSVQYTGGRWLIRLCIRIAFAYEKHTTVLYQPVSQCRRPGRCWDRDVRDPAFAHTSGRKSPRSF